MSEYKKGWYDAFDIIADYVEKEICVVTGSMIKRMRDEDWRFKEVFERTSVSNTHPQIGRAHV